MAEETKNQPPAAPPPLKGVSDQADEDLLEPGEQVLTVVRRSAMGLAAIYLVAFVAVAAITALVIVLAPDTFQASGENISGALSLIFIFSATLLVLILFSATHVYRQSRLLITDRSLVQVIQKTLFNRTVTRLSMANVEDAKEEQRGLISSIFNYGTLTVETAGARENFIFTMCPGPTKLADQIIEARQAYTRTYGDKE